MRDTPMMHFRHTDRARAQADPLGAVMIVGDYGGFTYLISKASGVEAGDDAICQLGLELDAIFTRRGNPFEIRMSWGITNSWDEWGGKTKLIEDSLWINQRLIDRGVSIDHVKTILSGKQSPDTNTIEDLHDAVMG